MADKDGREEIFVITDTSQSRGDSIKGRRRRYLIAMGIRVACFVLMIVLPIPLEGRLLLALGAIFLPYFAVVAANAYDSRLIGSKPGFLGVSPMRIALPGRGETQEG